MTDSSYLRTAATRAGIQVPSPANRREWEDRLVLTAAHFTCSVPLLGTRVRGQRLQWDVQNYDKLQEACWAAETHPRALVYAVGATGDSAPLARADWGRYIAARGEA